MPEKTCGICRNKFHLHENKSGLVFNDNIFICEPCTKKSGSDFISEWSNTIMQHPENGMPVALWLIQEQNKDKPIFSKKRD